MMPFAAPLGRVVRVVGLCVIVALITVAAVGSYINARQVDSDSKARAANDQAQRITGCLRGNELRALVAAQAAGLKAADLYIAHLLRAAVANAPPTATPAQLARTLKQASHFEGLAAALVPPAQNDCHAL